MRGTRRQILRASSAACLAGVLPACAAARQETPDPALQAACESGVGRGFIGVAALVLDPHAPARRASAGLAHAQAGVGMTTGSAFHMCSITKAFTAAAALQLVDAGALAPDTVLTHSAIAEDVRGLANAERITIAQLFDHSSGLYATNNDPAYLDVVLGANADPTRIFTPQDFIDLARRAEPSGEPGQGHWYSDVNYVLLGLLVERASGGPFRDFVRERILTPLNLEETYFYSERLSPDLESVRTMHGYFLLAEETAAALQEAGLSVGALYQPVPGLAYEGAPYLDTTLASERVDAAAGLVTTLADLGRFGRALFDGRLLSPSSQQLIMAAGADMETLPPGETRTRALRATHRPYGALVYASGDSPGGFNTLLAFHPESARVIVCVINTFGHFDELDWMIDTIVPAALQAS